MEMAMPRLSKDYPLNGVTLRMLSGELSLPDTGIALPLSLAIEFIWLLQTSKKKFNQSYAYQKILAVSSGEATSIRETLLREAININPMQPQLLCVTAQNSTLVFLIITKSTPQLLTWKEKCFGKRLFQIMSSIKALAPHRSFTVMY